MIFKYIEKPLNLEYSLAITKNNYIINHDIFIPIKIIQ